MTKTLDLMAREMLGGPGDDTIVEYEGQLFTRAWLRSIADELESRLKTISTGREGLGFVARNRPSCVAALLGMIAAGRTITMIYAFQSADALAQNIQRLKLQAVVISEEDLSAPVLDAAAREGIAVIALGDSDKVRLALPARAGDDDRIASDESEPCVRLLTSGTTGQPKHYPMAFHVIADFTKDGAAGMSARSDSIPSLVYFPLANISGLMMTLPSLLAGNWIILLDRFDVQLWRKFMARFRPPRASLPPAGFRMVLDANVPTEDLAGVKIVSTGNSALDPAVQAAFEKRYGLKVLTAYGATEFAGSAAAMTEAMYDEWGDRKRGSVGRACSGVSIRIMDQDSGEILPPGEQGVVEVQVERLGPNWIRTTDLGLVDEDGFVFLRGRSDGAIVRGGFKILPEAIEQVLVSHPDIAAAVVVGVADARLGKVPAALVQPVSSQSSPDPEALKAHVRQHLLATHVPTNIWVVDQIPRTPSLKIDRATARAWIERKMANPEVVNAAS